MDEVGEEWDFVGEMIHYRRTHPFTKYLSRSKASFASFTAAPNAVRS